MKNLLLIIILAIGFMACNSDSTKSDANNKTAVASKNCTYTYSPDSSLVVGWKAYKTTEKIGVGGKFDQARVKVQTQSSANITELINGVQFMMPVMSTITSDTSRDRKIKQYFFGAMANTKAISGNIKNATGSNDAGTCTVGIVMNETMEDVIMNYTQEDGLLTLKGEIDLASWKAEAAVASLNKVCYELHKGKDGVSKTWMDVALEVQVKLAKDCE